MEVLFGTDNFELDKLKSMQVIYIFYEAFNLSFVFFSTQTTVEIRYLYGIYTMARHSARYSLALCCQ